MNLLRHDKDILIINNLSEMKETLAWYSKPEFWKKVYADEIRSFGVSNMPILAESIIEDKGMKDTCSTSQFNECVADIGIFTALPNSEGTAYETFAGRFTSYLSMYDRSGTSCRMIKTIHSHGEITALSAEERGEEINRGWQTSKELLSVYIPDGKIGYFGSKKYVILSMEEGLDSVVHELSASYPDAKYIAGNVSYEYILAEWKLNACEDEESYALRLEELGVIDKDQKTPFYLRYSTSNVGNAKMSVRLFVEIAGVKIPLGKPQSIWHHSDKFIGDKERLDHDNGCSMDDFRTKLTWIGRLLKENEDIIEVLGNTDIKHPAGCLQHLLAECNSIPAKDKKSAIEDMDTLYPDTCSAIDVYIMASSLAMQDASPRQIVNITEEIAQLQFKNFALYDKPLKIEE